MIARACAVTALLVGAVAVGAYYVLLEPRLGDVDTRTDRIERVLWTGAQGLNRDADRLTRIEGRIAALEGGSPNPPPVGEEGINHLRAAIEAAFTGDPCYRAVNQVTWHAAAAVFYVQVEIVESCRAEARELGVRIQDVVQRTTGARADVYLYGAGTELEQVHAKPR